MRPFVLAFCLGLAALAAAASEPRLLVSAPAGGSLTNPVCSPYSDAVAYSTATFDTLFFWRVEGKPPLRVSESEGIGRRFIFEPGQERLVYRQVVGALENKPERLISTAPYLYDPAVRTTNQDAEIFGPYLIDNHVWYRTSLLDAYRDYRDSVRQAGPYLDRATGRLTVVNDAADTVFASQPPSGYVGMEISPDGQWVAAVASRPRVQLTLIHVADGATRELPGGAAPSWSGDARSMAYVISPTGGPVELHRYDIQTAEDETLLRDTRFRPETPALNTDGTRAVFISHGDLYDLDVER